MEVGTRTQALAKCSTGVISSMSSAGTTVRRYGKHAAMIVPWVVGSLPYDAQGCGVTRQNGDWQNIPQSPNASIQSMIVENTHYGKAEVLVSAERFFASICVLRRECARFT